MDFVFCVASIVFNYAGPFFLKLVSRVMNVVYLTETHLDRRILEAIDDPTPEARWTAYVYAFLAFLSAMIVVQTDLQHLWFSRRALNRSTAELMAVIYEKSLKRKDVTGAPDATQDNAPATGNSSPRKANAHVGKVVNLMSGDVNATSRVFIYVRLCPTQMLKPLTCFAGVLVLWNSY